MKRKFNLILRRGNKLIFMKIVVLQVVSKKHTKYLLKSAEIGVKSGVTQSSNMKILIGITEQDILYMYLPKLFYQKH